MRKILFICVENAGRSQMAEAFFRKHTHNKLHVSSAGTKPILSVNPVVVEVMNEICIDVKDNIPRSLTNEMLNDSIVVDRKSTRLNSSHVSESRMPSSA